jgi:hypothetical protein
MERPFDIIVEVKTLVLNPPLLTFLMIPLDSSLLVTRIRTPLHDSFFELHTNVGSQPTIDSKWKKDYKEVDLYYIAQMVVDKPFIASCSPYFKPMLDVIVSFVSSFKGPNFHDLRSPLLLIVQHTTSKDRKTYNLYEIGSKIVDRAVKLMCKGIRDASISDSVRNNNRAE